MPFLEFVLGYSKGSRGSHWAAPEPMCLPTMTQAGREHATQCIDWFTPTRCALHHRGISNNYLLQNMDTIRNKLSSMLLITITIQQILHLIHLKSFFKSFPYIYSVNWKVAFFNKRYQMDWTKTINFIKVTADIVRCIISNSLMRHIWVFISYKRI